MSVHRKLFTATIALAGMFAAAAVPAADRTNVASVEVVSVVVPYGDLNLESDRGVRQLHRRLVSAAHKVCGRPDQRDLRLHQAVRGCIDAALGRAISEIGSARLAQLNASRGKAFRG